MTEKTTPVPASVQDKMQEGVRQRYAIATEGLPPSKTGDVKL